MFRVKEKDGTSGRALAELVVQVALLLALLENLGSVFLIFEEYRGLETALEQEEPLSLVELASLRQNVGLQIVASLVLSALLAGCVVASWWLRRRFIASQRSLREVKLLAHDILASMDRGVVTADTAGVITSLNSAALGLLDVDLSCVGQPLTAISPAKMTLAEVHASVVRHQAPVRDRDYMIERVGRTLRLRVDGHLLKNPEGSCLGCVLQLRDVTERILLEERMRRMERFLGLASLASGLHHEIKNPLTALSIHVQLLEEGIASGQSNEAAELVGVLKTEMARLNGVLESFRNFANLDHLSIEPTNGLEVVENVLRLIRPQALNQRVGIAFHRPNADLPEVPLDAEKFGQAVLNLILNGLEAMPEGGQLDVAVGVADDELRVSIHDSGPGIPPEVQVNLFQPYFSTKSQGSGMGLALCEKLIGQHGGHIDYRTGPTGSTFEIAVPLVPKTGKPCATGTSAF